MQQKIFYFRPGNHYGHFPEFWGLLQGPRYFPEFWVNVKKPRLVIIVTPHGISHIHEARTATSANSEDGTSGHVSFSISRSFATSGPSYMTPVFTTGRTSVSEVMVKLYIIPCFFLGVSIKICCMTCAYRAYPSTCRSHRVVTTCQALNLCLAKSHRYDRVYQSEPVVTCPSVSHDPSRWARTRNQC